MQIFSSFTVLAIFLIGCVTGALLNSIYRAAMLARIKEKFELELQPPVEQQAWHYTKTCAPSAKTVAAE